jgi:hypothetical protein
MRAVLFEGVFGEVLPALEACARASRAACGFEAWSVVLVLGAV